jgi:hypothetical protein
METMAISCERALRQLWMSLKVRYSVNNHHKKRLVRLVDLLLPIRRAEPSAEAAARRRSVSGFIP